MDDIKQNESPAEGRDQTTGPTWDSGPQSCGAASGRCGSGRSGVGQPANPLEALHQVWSQFSGGQPRTGRRPGPYSANNKVDNGAKKFTIKLDMENYEPSEIEVKIVDKENVDEVNSTVKPTGKIVVISAEHPERTDRLGRVSRRFQRKFELPEDVEAETIVSTMTPQGVLIIEGLKKKTTNAAAEVVIPVLREGDNKEGEQNYQNDQQMD